MVALLLWLTGVGDPVKAVKILRETAGEQINAVEYRHTMEYHSQIKRNEVSHHEMGQSHLEPKPLRERSQPEKAASADSNEMAFWRRQKCGDSKKARGWGRGG